MRFEIELQQLQNRSAVARGQGQTERANVHGFVLQFQADGDFVGGERLRFETGAQVVENARDQEQQRIEQLNGVLQLDAVLIRNIRLVYAKRPFSGAARQVLQMDALRAQSLGNA